MINRRVMLGACGGFGVVAMLPSTKMHGAHETSSFFKNYPSRKRVDFSRFFQEIRGQDVHYTGNGKSFHYLFQDEKEKDFLFGDNTYFVEIPASLANVDYLYGNCVFWGGKNYYCDPYYSLLPNIGIPLENRSRQDIRDACAKSILTTGMQRNMVVLDDSSKKGMTKRIVSLMKTVMKLNSGKFAYDDEGELYHTSDRKRALTDLIIPLEVWENWKPLPEDNKYNLLTDKEDRVINIFGVDIHPSDELNIGQKYDSFLKNDLKYSAITRIKRETNHIDEVDKQHIVVGISRNKLPLHFVMPTYEDKTGIAILDTASVLLGAI